MAAATIRIGISGWRYAPWRGVFYPKGLPQRAELAYASRRLPSIELNGSFYSLQRPESYREWHDDTPEGFLFAIKGGRYITHLRRLRDVEAPLANFFASGVLQLGAKLGPFLWQFPPNFVFDAESVEHFFRLLPRTSLAAAALAAGHDDWMRSRAWYAVTENRPLRHVMEVRHPSFATPEFVALLRQHNVALVVADTAGKWPFMEDVTADFLYLRLHGDEELYASGYSPDALATWARKMAAWTSGHQPEDARTICPAATAPRAVARDVYVYFDNDIKVHAPFDALSLAHRLGLAPPPEGSEPDATAIAQDPGKVVPVWSAFTGATPHDPAPAPPREPTPAKRAAPARPRVRRLAKARPA